MDKHAAIKIKIKEFGWVSWHTNEKINQANAWYVENTYFLFITFLCIFLLSIERFNQTFSREAKFGLTIDFEIPIYL
jgi:hypothetical protein